MEVAFITSSTLDSLYEDDRLAATGLMERGLKVVPVVWDSPATTPEALARFDAVVMRSPWDWFKKKEAFRSFLLGLERVPAPVFNPPAMLRRFADKVYLLELAGRGVPVPPTLALEPDELDGIPELMEARGWHEAVLKPSFSAGAFDTYKFFRHRALEAVGEAVSLEASERWLLQPYLPEILQGELGFVFFGGAFSHAVKKVPPAGEWRVQELHGGLVEPVDVTEGELAQAQAILTAAGVPDALYARVDCVTVGGQLVLMELEVVEPELFFRFDSGAAGRFADALVKALGRAS